MCTCKTNVQAQNSHVLYTNLTNNLFNFLIGKNQRINLHSRRSFLSHPCNSKSPSQIVSQNLPFLTWLEAQFIGASRFECVDGTILDRRCRWRRKRTIRTCREYRIYRTPLINQFSITALPILPYSLVSWCPLEKLESGTTGGVSYKEEGGTAEIGDSYTEFDIYRNPHLP